LNSDVNELRGIGVKSEKKKDQGKKNVTSGIKEGTLISRGGGEQGGLGGGLGLVHKANQSEAGLSPGAKNNQ